MHVSFHPFGLIAIYTSFSIATDVVPFWYLFSGHTNTFITLIMALQFLC